MRTQCTDRVRAIVVLQKKAGLVLGSNLVYSGWEFSLQLDNQSITIHNQKPDVYFINGRVQIWVQQYWCLHFT